MWKRQITKGFWSLVGALIAVAASLVAETRAYRENYPERLLVFPDNKTFGDLFIVRAVESDNDCFKGSKLLAKARGRVKVPAGLAVRLSVLYEGSFDLSPLTVLAADSIQSIDLSRAEVNPQSCRFLSHLTGLQEINCSDSEFDDGCAEILWHLKHLRGLAANRTQLRDAGMKQIARVSSLKVLSIDSNEVTDAGIKELAALKNLHSLHIQNTRCGNAGVEAVSHLPLLSLNLNATRIDNKALPAIGNIKTLTYLQLCDTAVTDEGLPALAGLHALAKIKLPECISAQARLKFRRMLPACQILPIERRRTLESD